MINGKLVSKHYRHFALEKVSFQFDRGINLLKGKSGSGKTTLLQLALGIIKPEKVKSQPTYGRKMLPRPVFATLSLICHTITF